MPLAAQGPPWAWDLKKKGLNTTLQQAGLVDGAVLGWSPPPPKRVDGFDWMLSLLVLCRAMFFYCLGSLALIVRALIVISYNSPTTAQHLHSCYQDVKQEVKQYIPYSTFVFSFLDKWITVAVKQLDRLHHLLFVTLFSYTLSS